jgi:acetyl esterase/lipase
MKTPGLLTPSKPRKSNLHRATAITILSIVSTLVILAASGMTQAQAQNTWPLWPSGAPGSQKNSAPEKVRVTPEGDHVISSISQPSITLFLPAPETATGVAVVIAPGGGHRELWIDHEGYAVAKFLQQHGVAAFVLKYRLAREEGSTYTVEGTELADIQRAIRLVRSRAAQEHIRPDAIGVMGFSAGGELAALAATHFNEVSPSAIDPNDSSDLIDRQSSRPAFQALIYPAIPKNMAITANTPPAFLACGEKDRPDISEGLPKLYLALKQAGVSAELLIYANTGHGFGIRATNPAAISTWPVSFLDWLQLEHFLPAK